MVKYDLANLLCMWDESLVKLIDHLENGRTERALMRAKEMHKALAKLKSFCGICDKGTIDRI